MTATTTIPTKILIVEDELLAAENLARNLKKQGYEITSIVDSGEAAIANAKQSHPDLVLMDIMLQGDMDGITAAQTIDSQLKIPIVYMTAYADETTLKKAKMTNPSGYLVKPFKPQDLRVNIELALHRSHSELNRLQDYLFQLRETKKKLYQLRKKRDINLLSSEQKSLAKDLGYALKRQELSIVYQPRVNLQTGRVVGAEALLRWHHPQRGAIIPTYFIPLAELTGSIEPIGEWVIQTACQQLRSWQDSGWDSLKISVNLSGYQLQQPDLDRRIRQIFIDTEVDPRAIELELTESFPIQNIDLFVQRLHALKAVGVRLAIDDFGTGYSCLSHLHRFPFDTLKLDRAFVQRIDANVKNATIATAIISLAHQLKLKVVAEGVETASELYFLRQNGCDEMQGYFFSPPLPASEFFSLLKSLS